MRNGDLSNRTAPYVYFDIDSLLYDTVEVERKILGIPIKPATKLVISELFRRQLVHLFRKYDLNVVLFSITDSDTREYLLEEVLYEEKFIYNRLEIYKSVMKLREQDFTYLFSADNVLLSSMSSYHAMHIDKFGEVFSK